MKALAPVLDQARGGTDLIALVKPQFELGRTWLGKGGLVKPGGVEEALRRVSAALSEAGWAVLASTNSPITGGDGNKEILLHACRTNTDRRGAADSSQRGA
jgi:23S rRNA (cytidine1920-2'-O)/16S rRNA (cytidine1409-2'-O)-methyltransferase